MQPIIYKLPFGPHDYQLEGTGSRRTRCNSCCLGDGTSKISIFLAVILLELVKDPSLSPSQKKFPSDPAMVVVYPATALEDDRDLVRSLEI